MSPKKVSSKLFNSTKSKRKNDVAVDKHKSVTIDKRAIKNISERVTFNYTLAPDDCDNELLNIITGRSWVIHRASPIYYLQYKEVNLKRYSKWMRDRLVKELKQIDENEEIHTKFTAISLSDSEYTPKALQFEVTAVNEEDDKKTLYEGLFLSWIDDEKDENFTPLSILLCRGSVLRMHQVNSLLEKLFESRINQLFISQEDMLWLSAFLSTDTKKLNKNLILKLQFDEKDFINVILPMKSVWSLWKNVHDENLDEVYGEEIDKFHSNLEEHLNEIYSIDLSKLTLITVNSPNILLRFNGFFKTFDNTTTLNVLRFLHVRCYLINLTDK